VVRKAEACCAAAFAVRRTPRVSPLRSRTLLPSNGSGPGAHCNVVLASGPDEVGARDPSGGKRAGSSATTPGCAGSRIFMKQRSEESLRYKKHRAWCTSHHAPFQKSLRTLHSSVTQPRLVVRILQWELEIGAAKSGCATCAATQRGLRRQSRRSRSRSQRPSRSCQCQ
jgi:hypothetical protein